MFQGDPLSVSIFNVVINTLVDPLVWHCLHLGYCFSSSTICLNLLQCADDTCLLACDPPSCQRMVNVMEEWLIWSGMKVKPSKCQAVAHKSRTNADNRVYDPQLVLGSFAIPFLGKTITSFLGMPLYTEYYSLPGDYIHQGTRNEAEDRLCPLVFQVQAFDLLTSSSSKSWLDLEDYPHTTVICIRTSGGMLH